MSGTLRAHIAELNREEDKCANMLLVNRRNSLGARFAFEAIY
jgi:hypothetical protein